MSAFEIGVNILDMEKTLYVISSFATQIKRDMELLGWKVVGEKPVLYTRRMKVICDSYRPELKTESIYEIRFFLEDAAYETRQKETEEYLQLMEEPFQRPAKYRFCLPIIIASTAMFFFMAFCILWILTLPGGPFHNGGWAYIVYILTLGLAPDVVVPTIVILVILGLAVLISLSAAIVFLVLLQKKKKQSQMIFARNEELAEKKRGH